MENKIKAPTKGESRIIKFMILLGIFSILNFLFYFFQPEHVGNALLFTLLTVTILYSVLKKLYMWYNYSNISTPEKPENHANFKVDVLTTYYPGEPYQMVITTLETVNKEHVSQIQQNRSKIRHDMIEYLSSRTVDDLEGLKEKEKLRLGLIRTINNALGLRSVRNLYYSKYVMQ
jgi:flagellar basal body-associated protein FliL